jgi:hypothetical protein
VTDARRVHPRTAAFETRLRRYLDLREDGTDSREAAREVGVTDATRRRYEHWHRAGMAPGQADSGKAGT